MRELVRPEEVKIEEETFSSDYGKFVIEPLERGYGTTIGNSLRRILLSSIPGAAVISIKVEGATHEFATIPGVKEDILQIIQNLKKLRIRIHTDKRKEIFLEETGPLEVQGRHIKTDNEVEVLSPDLHIATLDDEKSKLSMQINVSKGRGYVEASENREENDPVGTIPVDSIFSPVSRVKYEVHPVRVGRKTTYDSLIMEIWTDKTIQPDEALNQAAKILHDFSGLLLLRQEKKKEEEEKKDEKERLEEEFLKKKIDEIEFSTVALNALKNAGITTIGEVVKKKPKELLMIHNFGEKSLEKLEKELAKYNLSLRKEKEDET